MIPDIETIVAGLLDGTIGKDQAIAWLKAHAFHATEELRDTFAGQFATLATVTAIVNHAKGEAQPTPEDVAAEAYKFANAMLKARSA